MVILCHWFFLCVCFFLFIFIQFEYFPASNKYIDKMVNAYKEPPICQQNTFTGLSDLFLKANL